MDIEYRMIDGELYFNMAQAVTALREGSPKYKEEIESQVGVNIAADRGTGFDTAVYTLTRMGQEAYAKYKETIDDNKDVAAEPAT